MQELVQELGGWWFCSRLLGFERLDGFGFRVSGSFCLFRSVVFRGSPQRECGFAKTGDRN